MGSFSGHWGIVKTPFLPQEAFYGYVREDTSRIRPGHMPGGARGAGKEGRKERGVSSEVEAAGSAQAQSRKGHWHLDGRA